MSRTGAHLKVTRMGDNVLGVRLEGDRRKPEPDAFRVVFPGGDVDVSRTLDGEYWIHVRVDRPGRRTDEDGPTARIVDARLDIEAKHAADTDAGDFAHPDLYHLAVRIARE